MYNVTDMAKIFVTRRIPRVGLEMLGKAGHKLTVSEEDRPLSKAEIITALKKDLYDGVLCLLTDTIDKEIYEVTPHTKIFANYAVGVNNIDVEEAKRRGVVVTNTPGALTESVAEHAITLILSLMKRVVEGDKFVRDGKFSGFAPELLLGADLKGKTLGIIGAGRIGARVAEIAVKGFDMRVIYYDIKRSEIFERETGARFGETVEVALKEADVVSIHVPLLPETRHLINKERLVLMKSTAYLVNTSRGKVVDENALVDALRKRVIAGAALDVFENEPALAAGLSELPNVVLTPHTASATKETREEMAVLAAQNLIDFFEGGAPANKVT